jgi:phosphatidylglycerophosphate synthase
VRAVRPWAANLITALRLLGAPLLAWSLSSDRVSLAAALVGMAIASDVGDGWVARRLRTTSAAGRWFDHAADIAFLLAGFGTLAWRGAVPALVPLAIGGAFLFYVVDSLRRSATRSLVGSRLGHLSGILNYAILCAVVCNDALDGPLPSPLLGAALASVPLYSAAAILGRVAGGR